DLILVGTSYMDRARKDCIVLQNRELLRTKNFTNVGGTQDAFDIVKAVGFVLCDTEWRSIFLIAARTVLATPSSVKPAELAPPRSRLEAPLVISLIERMLLDLKGVLRRSGVPRSKFEATLEAATTAGYFDSKPFLAPPIDPTSNTITQIATN